jgi:L-ribulose-5-phosphate 3-epimerase
VAPERAAEDLPRAVAAIRAEGLEVPMITTELLTADDPTAVPILRTASQHSIPFLKPGYYRYQFIDVVKELEQAGHRFRGLVDLAAQYRIQVGYHNHEQMIGAPVWDMAKIMETLDPKWAGYYFDLQHATIDGGASCWRVSANLAMPRMKMMAVKDFYWKKTAAHQWIDTDCPMGQGMCHWSFFMKMAAQGGFHGPISLHMEYEIPGVTDHEGIALSRANDDEAMAAAKQNLDTLKLLTREAYGEA